MLHYEKIGTNLILIAIHWPNLPGRILQLSFQTQVTLPTDYQYGHEYNIIILRSMGTLQRTFRQKSSLVRKLSSH